MNPNDYLESVVNDQLVRLYVIKNIPHSTEFKPRTRCEIKACNWFAVTDLPNNRKDFTPKLKIGVGPNSFFMVLPFVKRLKNICNNQGSSKKYRQKTEIESTGSKSKVKSNAKAEEVKKRDKKHSKRQLFAETAKSATREFSAPSWENFKFDMKAIMDCLQ